MTDQYYSSILHIVNNYKKLDKGNKNGFLPKLNSNCTIASTPTVGYKDCPPVTSVNASPRKFPFNVKNIVLVT